MPTPNQLTSITTYDNVRIVDAIIADMEAGNFFQSALLVDQVLRNSRIFSTLMTRIEGLLGKPKDFEPATEIDGRSKSTAQKICDEIEDAWPRMFSHSSLVDLMIWAIMQGIGLARINEEEEPWQLEVWHPWALTWDEYERNYYLQTREHNKLWILPDGKGGFRSEDGTRWVLYTPYGFANAGRRGLIRVIARLYLELEWAHRDRARYSEVHGQPIRLAIAPQSASDDEVKEYKKRCRLGAEAVIVARQGPEKEGARWGLELVEAMGKSGELFENEIEQLHREIATLLHGQSQTTDGQAGLGSNDQAGEPVRLDRLKAEGESLMDCLYPQFLKPYCEFSYGSADMAPWMCFHVDPPEDREKKANEFKTVVDGLVAAKTAAIAVDEREVLEDFAIPMVTEAEQVAMEAERAAMQPAPAAEDQPKNGAAATANYEA